MVKTVTNVRNVDRAALKLYMVSFLAKHRGEAIDDKLLDEFRQHVSDFGQTETAHALDRDLIKAVAETSALY